MGQLKKKGTSGAAKNFITRNQALKKLQVSLPDFRRLCILKGIYPRDPKNKKKISPTGSTASTFYWTKDIQFLMHEPLLNTLRETKSFAKKISKYVGKKDWAKVASLEENLKPDYSLDHLIKERYPTFVDALRDMDDALSMLYLFASLPNTTNFVGDKLKKTVTLLGQEQLEFAHSSAQLLREFEAYLLQTGAVKKTFISIKGIYYQAELLGQTVTWIVPHERSTPLPTDVDFRVMHTFLEFYQTLLGFVNFKLFSRLGWSYPLAPTMLRKSEADDESSQYRPVLITADLPRVSEDLTATQTAAPAIFTNFTFYLSREVPRHSLSLLIQSMGGRVGWACDDESSPFAEDDPSITHHVVDRPNLARMFNDRVYVQPQWVFDSMNAGKIADVSSYRIGATLPPHVSPFYTESSESEAVEVTATSTNAKMSDEQKKLAVSMLSKKQKKLYDSMQRGISKKNAVEERLEKRRQEIKASSANKK